MSDRNVQAFVDAGKAVPAIAVTFGAQMAEMTVEEWAFALTIVYTSLLIIQWFWRLGVKVVQWRRDRKATKRMDFEQQPRDAVPED